MFSKTYNQQIKIDYNNVDSLNRYPSDLMGEYLQCTEEGLDVEKYKSLFEAVSALDNGEYKTRMSNIIYEMVINAEIGIWTGSSRSIIGAVASSDTSRVVISSDNLISPACRFPRSFIAIISPK